MPQDSDDIEDLSDELADISDRVDVLEADIDERRETVEDIQLKMQADLEILNDRIQNIEEDSASVESLHSVYEYLEEVEHQVARIRTQLESTLEDDLSDRNE
jgi:prefoldin subunit 5